MNQSFPFALFRTSCQAECLELDEYSNAYENTHMCTITGILCACMYVYVLKSRNDHINLYMIMTSSISLFLCILRTGVRIMSKRNDLINANLFVKKNMKR